MKTKTPYLTRIYGRKDYYKENLSTGNRHLNEGVRLVNLPADDLNTAIIE